MPFRRVHLPLMALFLASACSDGETALPVNAVCTSNNDCADQVCHSGTCATFSKERGKACSGNGECRTFNCVKGTCMAGAGKSGSECVHDEQCFDGRCGPKGTCIGKGPDAGVALDAAPLDLEHRDSMKQDVSLPDQTPLDLPLPDKAIPDIATPDLLIPDQVIPDQAIPDQALPDQALPDQALPDLMQPDLMQPDLSLCGNGKLDPTEVCDGALLGGKTCVIQGFTAGTLSCPNCTLDVSRCYKLLDPSPLKLPATAAGLKGIPSVASDGKDFLVAWHYPSVSIDVAAASVSAAGKVGPRVVVTQTAEDESSPGVASDGKSFLIAWGAKVHRATMMFQGKVITPLGIHLGYGSSPRSGVSFDGSNFMVAWEGKIAGSIYAVIRLVSPKGTTVSAVVAVSMTGSTSSVYYKPAIGFNGSRHVVAWHRSGDLYAALVSTAGKVILSKDIAVSTAAGIQHYPAVAGDGSGNALVVWQDTRYGGSDILAKRVGAGGALVGPDDKPTTTALVISISGYKKSYPAVAFDGSHYLVVWGEPGASGQDIKALRLDSKGNKVGPAFTVHSNKNGILKFPAVAYGGGQWLVVWRDGSSSNHAMRIKFGGP